MKKVITIIELLLQTNHDIHNTIRKKLNPTLSLQQIIVMKFLKSNKKACLKEIANYLQITNPSTSILINKLKKRGFIEKKENVYDRRSYSFEISLEWVKHMKKEKERVIKSILPYFKNFSEKEGEQLIMLLKKIEL